MAPRVVDLVSERAPTFIALVAAVNVVAFAVAAIDAAAVTNAIIYAVADATVNCVAFVVATIDDVASATMAAAVTAAIVNAVPER